MRMGSKYRKKTESKLNKKNRKDQYITEWIKEEKKYKIKYEKR